RVATRRPSRRDRASRRRDRTWRSPLPPRDARRLLRERSRAPCSVGPGDDDRVALAPDVEPLEAIADTRAADAASGARLVDRAVRRADERAAVLGEELVRPEVERRPDVGTTVDVRVVAAVHVHDEGVDGPGAARQAEL